MKVLVDTNIFIDHLRGDADATHFLLLVEQGRHAGYCSTMNEYELLAVPTIYPVRWERVQRLLALFQILPITSAVVHRAADFRRRYRTPDGDAIIAATADLIGAVMVTRNIKHFKPIKELQVSSIPFEA